MDTFRLALASVAGWQRAVVPQNHDIVAPCRLLLPNPERSMTPNFSTMTKPVTIQLDNCQARCSVVANMVVWLVGVQ